MLQWLEFYAKISKMIHKKIFINFLPNILLLFTTQFVVRARGANMHVCFVTSPKLFYCAHLFSAGGNSSSLKPWIYFKTKFPPMMFPNKVDVILHKYKTY